MSHISAVSAATTVSDEAAQAVLLRNNVRLTGSGQLTLLFCNGFNCGQNVWHLLAPALAARHRLVFFDQMGVGNSDRTACQDPRYQTLQGYVQDVLDIVQALDLRQAVLVGHSAGALIAFLAARQTPERFAKVVLLSTSPYYINTSDYYGGFELETIHQILAEMDTNYQAWANTFATMMIGQYDAPALSHELVECASRADRTLAKRMVEFVFLGDYRAQFPSLQQPALLLQCTDDPAVPEEVNRYLLAHMPQATLVRMPTAGHCPHLTTPAAVLEAIETFLAH